MHLPFIRVPIAEAALSHSASAIAAANATKKTSFLVNKYNNATTVPQPPFASSWLTLRDSCLFSYLVPTSFSTKTMAQKAMTIRYKLSVLANPIVINNILATLAAAGVNALIK